MTKGFGICPQCGKEFHCYIYPYRKSQQYCSRGCLSTARRITTSCPTCGKEFWYHISWPRKYCSSKCAGKTNVQNIHKFQSNPKHLIQCDNCGISFKKKASEIAKTDHHFCSLKCFGEWVSSHQCGNKHPNWRGGYEPYYGPNWPTQRRKARRRDNYACQCCGITEEELGRQLDVHHKMPFREFGKYKEANALKNLISLCNKCHSLLQNGGAVNEQAQAENHRSSSSG